MSWLKHLFSRRKLYSELSEEIREHLEEKIDELVESGMSRKQAVYAAHREFGNVTLIEERGREVWGWALVEDFLIDVRIGARMLRKNPGFAALVIVTLALGIAANTTIFSAVNGWMLRPPKIKDPSRVVIIFSTDPAKGLGWDQNPISVPDFIAWREQNQVFEDMVASQGGDFALTGEGEPERLEGMRVSASYFNLLGVSAALGRNFLPGEDQPGHDQVVILSYGLWQRRFASNPKVLGESVRLNGDSYRVVGVMPKGYRLGFYSTQLWTPLVFPPQSVFATLREDHSLNVMARLKSEVGVAAANAEMAALAQSSEQTYPGTDKGWGAKATLLHEYMADEFRDTTRLLMGAVIVLLIGCANIANLQLARGIDRQRELVVRAALGAGRFRLVRQLLVESLLLAFAGGVLGLLFASWGMAMLRSALTWRGDYESSMAREVTFDNTVLAFTLGISVFAAILFGLAPALRQTALDLHSTFKEGGRTSSQGKTRNRTHSVLAAAEIALALALLTGEGILVQDFFYRVYGGYGIDPNQVLTADISLSSTRYKDPSKQADFFQNVIQRLGAIPGVISAGATATLMPGEGEGVVTFSVAGQPGSLRTVRERMTYFTVSSDYLRTLRIPLLRGRSFLPTDTIEAPHVILVNQTFVQRYFPNEEALGKRVRLDSRVPNHQDWTEIVGIVGNVRDWFGERPDTPQIYEPYFQNPSPVMTLVARTSSDPAALAPMLRTAVWNVDKNQPIAEVQTMKQVISDWSATGLLQNSLMGIFAGLSVLLAIVGVFGVMAYTVARRTHEIGIRMALGAQRKDILTTVAWRGIVLGVCGVGIGLALAAPLLIWLQPMDPVDNAQWYSSFNQRLCVFPAAALLIGLTALLASYIPARRTTKVDPVVALRYE